MQANADAFLDHAAAAISRSMAFESRRKKPRHVYEIVSAETCANALRAFEALPRYNSELSRKLDGLKVAEGIRTTAPLVSIKARVSGFARKTGKRYKVFSYAGSVYVVRKE